MTDNSHPCICGHSKINHKYAPDRFGSTISCQVGYCDCEKFKLDKLGYLEKQYDKRNTSN